MNEMNLDSAIDELPDDVLHYIAQSFAPWSMGTHINDEPVTDEDGFPVKVVLKDLKNFSHLQKTCWEKFNENPQLNSHVRDVKGTLTGSGFGVGSEIEDIDDVLYEHTTDFRNELYKNLPKYVARSEAEGELFLAFTLHTDGFVEIDFMEPSSLKGGGDYNSGIYFHPNKAAMPLFYEFTVKVGKSEKSQIFPSIYLAHYPSLNKYTKEFDIKPEQLASAKTENKKYKKLNGYKTFIVAWDKGYLVPRNLSHISTTIEWINHYVNLKKWEIDHKKSAGSYLWIVSMTDTKAFRTWLKMTPDQRKETGLTAKKTPGGTLILPPGVEIECKNPNLTSISEQDTDIMHMITSGLNKPEDMVTGQTKGDTFSGIKASRGPQSDRTQDMISDFERFLKYDFWRPLFILRNHMVPGFKLDYKIKKAVEFKNQEPVFKNKKVKAWELIDFDFPISEISDLEAKARALLGVKHASVVESLGIPRQVVAKRLGFGKYVKNRLLYETENEYYPELPTSALLEQAQSMQGEGDSVKNNAEDNKNKPEE